MKADNINETTLTRKPRPVGGELYSLLENKLNISKTEEERKDFLNQ